MAYDNLKKFIDKKGIKTANSTSKDAFKADKKGKTLSTKDKDDLLLMMAKDLGYLE